MTTPLSRTQMIYLLRKLAHDFEKKRNIYWYEYKKLLHRNHCLSIPLLFVTSFTAATSSAQASGMNGNTALPIVISVFGVTSAILTALQKYMRFAERAETSKYISKMYGLIASKVKGEIELILAGHDVRTQEDYNEFLDDINQEAQSLQLEIDIVPEDLMKYEHTKYVLSAETSFDDVDNLIQNHTNQQNDLLCMSENEVYKTENCEITID